LFVVCCGESFDMGLHQKHQLTQVFVSLSDLAQVNIN
jgi:hypothetical protein